jgi:hypothetical protein
MASVLELIQQFLCYGNTQCMQEFNRFAYQPIEGLFYLVFFPIVFIIVFVYLLSNKLFSEHKGLRILLAVAVFALIILQQWYYLFMQLGKLWYLGLIILGFFWLFLYGLRGGKSSGNAQSRTGGIAGGLLGGLGSERLMKKLAGAESSQAQLIRDKINVLKGMEPGHHGMADLISEIATDIQTFAAETSVGNKPIFSEVGKLYDEFQSTCKQKHKQVPKSAKETVEEAKKVYKAGKGG